MNVIELDIGKISLVLHDEIVASIWLTSIRVTGGIDLEKLLKKKSIHTFPHPDAKLVRSHCGGDKLGSAVIGASQLFVRSEEN